MARRDNYDPRRNGGGRNDYYSQEDLDATRAYNWDLEDQNGYYNGQNEQSEYDDGYYDDGYYDDGSYGDYDDYGDYDEAGYYDDGYYQDDYYEPPRRSGPSMAARAAGKANTEIYGRPRSRSSQSRNQQRPVQPRSSGSRSQARSSYDYEDAYVAPKKRRRKKRHPFRKFFTFLLVLALIVGGIYFMLFRAPEQWNDGYHTRKSGFYNILICATDEEEMRTDTIMLATLDQKNGNITLTSLPRDTIVDNGEYVPKLNGVYGIAGGGEEGAEALMDAVQTLLGFRPDGYAVINYEIFRDAVDAMGGVTFDVPMDMVVDDTYGNAMEIPAGEQLLDGATALGVCRYRYGYMMADIQRQYVQQSFLKAMIQQLCSVDKLTKLPAVYEASMDNVLTDLSGANIRYLALHVLLAGLGDIQQNTLPGEGVDYNGASCYGLYGQSVVDMVNGSMNPFEQDITLDDVHILTVSGGTLVESTWTGTAFDASAYEYD